MAYDLLPGSHLLVGMGIDAARVPYARDHGREADCRGLEIARAAGFDPNGAVTILQHPLMAAEGSFLSTHPGSEERADALRRAIAAPQP